MGFAQHDTTAAETAAFSARLQAEHPGISPLVAQLTMAVIAALKEQCSSVHSIGDDGDSTVIWEGETHTFVDGRFDMVKVARSIIVTMTSKA